MVRIINGDALEILPTLDLTDGVIITDPPWNVGKPYGQNTDDRSPVDYERWVDRWFSLLPRKKIVFPGLKQWPIYTKYQPTSLAVWYKRNGHARSGNFVYSKADPVLIWGVNFRGANIFDVPLELGFLADPFGRNHPCPQPVNLIKLVIGQLIERPKLIIDPFCGTGSVLRAAKDFNIPAIGIELNPTYCKIAERRLAQEAMLMRETRFKGV